MSSSDSAGVSQWEQYLLQLINGSRAEAGVRPLTFDSELNAAADGHSRSMDTHNYFSHTGIDGSSPGARITAAGYGWTTYGENLAYIGGSSAATLDAGDVVRLHTMLMNSPGHRANLLNPNFTEVGLGLTQGEYNGRPALFLTENFARPNAAEAAETDIWFG